VFEADKKLIIFDEIHKYKGWKNYLKGVYDSNKGRFKILVTGSARLDVFKKGGDSLLGRYHMYRLHPLSLAELTGSNPLNKEPFKELKFEGKGSQNKDIFNKLSKYGGFPEIFIKQSEKNLRRWHNERSDRVIKEDIRDMENIRDISALQVMVELLPSKVGSLFSINSLSQDLLVAHKTAAKWTEILERFYFHFRIYPYQSRLVRSIRKEPKLYLWDWSEIEDESIKYENLIASHLLKFCGFLYDSEGYKARLFYLRDKDQREADFIIAVDGKPWFCVEAKMSDAKISSSLRYFHEKLRIPFSYQVLQEKGIDQVKKGIRVISADKFLSALV
ncbi:MAG: AAA family ATPase, partial [Candidatus Margulisiibacteriota bacterium]